MANFIEKLRQRARSFTANSLTGTKPYVITVRTPKEDRLLIVDAANKLSQQGERISINAFCRAAILAACSEVGANIEVRDEPQQPANDVNYL